jgi:hypothetical protein
VTGFLCCKFRGPTIIAPENQSRKVILVTYYQQGTEDFKQHGTNMKSHHNEKPQRVD